MEIHGFPVSIYYRISNVVHGGGGGGEGRGWILSGIAHCIKHKIIFQIKSFKKCSRGEETQGNKMDGSDISVKSP